MIGIQGRRSPGLWTFWSEGQGQALQCGSGHMAQGDYVCPWEIQVQGTSLLNPRSKVFPLWATWLPWAFSPPFLSSPLSCPGWPQESQGSNRVLKSDPINLFVREMWV